MARASEGGFQKLDYYYYYYYYSNNYFILFRSTMYKWWVWVAISALYRMTFVDCNASGGTGRQASSENCIYSKQAMASSFPLIQIIVYCRQRQRVVFKLVNVWKPQKSVTKQSKCCTHTITQPALNSPAVCKSSRDYVSCHWCWCNQDREFWLPALIDPEIYISLNIKH